MTAPQPAPHEPEVEMLAKAARRFLWVLRRVFWIAGAVAIGYGVTTQNEVVQNAAGPTELAWTRGLTLICAGLPILLPVRWTFGPRWWVPLPFLVALWFVPSLSADDLEYGYILRIFASVVAYLVLLVWRTLWRLTKDGGG